MQLKFIGCSAYPGLHSLHKEVPSWHPTQSLFSIAELHKTQVLSIDLQVSSGVQLFLQICKL
jgi:hypothetical protein